MRQSLVPVLLLAAVALSSSNLLPILSTNLQEPETLGINGQQNDNIFSNRFNIRNVMNNMLYKVPRGTIEYDQKLEKMLKNVNTNNNRADKNYNVIIDNKEDHYDDEGFRKEQWHNYPRQLDRLHRNIFFQNIGMKQTYQPDDPDNIENNNNVQETIDRSNNDIATNELHSDSDNSGQNIYDAVIAATKPLLIFKIRLACLNNGLKNTDSTKYYDLQSNQAENIEEQGEKEKVYLNEENPPMKVKREGESVQDSEVLDDNSMGSKKAVNKRLFSLWSRLQSLSHKGHELPHRRHLHAFYSLPDADGNGILTAETRATLMRPPGSPLRWG